MATIKEIGESLEFKNLVATRWQVATILTILQFIAYYGFILLVAYAKPTMAMKIGSVTTLAIILGMLVIVVTFFLTLTYVLWANKTYDSAVENITKKIEKL